MEEIGPPDSHTLSAAEGWLGLGNVAEARAELSRIDPALQQHPAVLDMLWALSAREEDWPAALETARALLKTAPEFAGSWLHQAYALRRVPGGGLRAAWNALAPALDQFPDHDIIPYNLACYACQLDQLDQARILFRRALASGNQKQQKHLKEMALDDADLRPLWSEIRDM